MVTVIGAVSTNPAVAIGSGSALIAKKYHDTGEVKKTDVALTVVPELKVTGRVLQSAGSALKTIGKPALKAEDIIGVGIKGREQLLAKMTTNLSLTAGYSDETIKGLGLLANKEFAPSADGIALVKTHLNSLDPHPGNSMMISRLENALESGRKLSGADLVFYTHELTESAMMRGGEVYENAHNAALNLYKVSSFSVYAPAVIKALPDSFNSNWRNFWGITQ